MVEICSYSLPGKVIVPQLTSSGEEANLLVPTSHTFDTPHTHMPVSIDLTYLHNHWKCFRE